MMDDNNLLQKINLNHYQSYLKICFVVVAVVVAVPVLGQKNIYFQRSLYEPMDIHLPIFNNIILKSQVLKKNGSILYI